MLTRNIVDEALWCAACGNQSGQSLSAVVRGGEWSGVSGSQAIGSVGGHVGIAGGLSVSSGATGLARALAPPVAPKMRPIPALAIAGLCAFLVVAALLLLVRTWNIGIADGGELAYQVVGGLATVGLVFALAAVKVQREAARPEFERALRRHEQATEKWRSLFYCARCDSVYDPSTGASAPVDEFRVLLR